MDGCGHARSDRPCRPRDDAVATEIPIDDGVPIDLAITGTGVGVGSTSSTHVELRAIDPSTDTFVATVELPANHVGPLTATDDAVGSLLLMSGRWKLVGRHPIDRSARWTSVRSLAQIPAEVCQVNDSNCTPTRAVVADGSVWFEGHGRTALFASNRHQRRPAHPQGRVAVASQGRRSIWSGYANPASIRKPGRMLRTSCTRSTRTKALGGRSILVEGGQPDPITGSACPVAVGDGGVWVEGYDRDMNHVLWVACLLSPGEWTSHRSSPMERWPPDSRSTSRQGPCGRSMGTTSSATDALSILRRSYPPAPVTREPMSYERFTART